MVTTLGDAPVESMHPFEIRELRFRLQQRMDELEDGPEKEALRERIEAIREACPHAYPEDDPEKGWRCRDCDASRPPEPAEEDEDEEADESDGSAAES